MKVGERELLSTGRIGTKMGKTQDGRIVLMDSRGELLCEHGEQNSLIKRQMLKNPICACQKFDNIIFQTHKQKNPQYTYGLAPNETLHDFLEARREEGTTPLWAYESVFIHRKNGVERIVCKCGKGVHAQIDREKKIEDAHRRMAGVWWPVRPIKLIIRKFITAYALTAPDINEVKSEMIKAWAYAVALCGGCDSTQYTYSMDETSKYVVKNEHGNVIDVERNQWPRWVEDALYPTRVQLPAGRRALAFVLRGVRERRGGSGGRLFDGARYSSKPCKLRMAAKGDRLPKSNNFAAFCHCKIEKSGHNS